jgi:hypothetical protein
MASLSGENMRAAKRPLYITAHYNARNIHFDSWIHGGIRVGTVIVLSLSDRPTH